MTRARVTAASTISVPSPIPPKLQVAAATAKIHGNDDGREGNQESNAATAAVAAETR